MEGLYNLIDTRTHRSISSSSFSHHFSSAHSINGLVFDSYCIHSKSLLTLRRVDLAPKIMLARACIDGRRLHPYINLYRDYVNVLTQGTFCEGDGSRSSFAEYLESFFSLIDSLTHNGFDSSKGIIPCTPNGLILDGSHRVAAAIALDIQVRIAFLDVSAPNYGPSRFDHGKVPDASLYDAIQYCIRESPRIHALLLWPKFHNHALHLLSSIDFFREKLVCSYALRKVTLSRQGLHALVVHAYLDEQWIGDPSDRFKGAEYKSNSCSAGGRMYASLVLIEGDSSSVLSLKRQLRASFHSIPEVCHSTDHPREALRLFSLLYHPDAHLIANHGAPLRYKSLLHSILSLRRADIPPDLLICSSSVLGVCGLRMPNDIDCLSDLVSFECKLNFLSVESHNHIMSHYGESVVSLREFSSSSFMLWGLSFAAFDVCLRSSALRSENTKRLDSRQLRSFIVSKRVTHSFAYILSSFFFVSVRRAEYALLVPLKAIVKQLLHVNSL